MTSDDALIDETIRALLADGHLRLAARWQQHRQAVRFTWVGARHYEVDGHRIPWVGKGLALAWFALAAHRHRLPALPVQYVFTGRRPAACAMQALDRAADAIKPIHGGLAAAIAALGTQDGLLVAKRKVPVIVQCRSPVLERIALGHA